MNNNYLIADRVSKCLEIELKKHQEGLKKLQKEGETDIISFDELMPAYVELDELAWKTTDQVEKEKIVKKLNAYELHYASLGKDRKYGDKILLTDNNIEELINFVRKSIQEYGISNDSFSYGTNFFIRDVLRKMRDSYDDTKSEEYNRLNEFLQYFYMGEEVGETRQEKYTFVFNNDISYHKCFKISMGYDFDYMTDLFSINSDGNVIIDLVDKIALLEQKENELSLLENEEKKISEAEALIDQQKEGQDIGEK